MSKGTQNMTIFDFPSFNVDGVQSARGTSILNNIEMDEEFLGWDSYFGMQVSGCNAEDLTQSVHKQVLEPTGSSDPPSPTMQQTDDDAKTNFSLEILVSDNATTLVMENVIPSLKEMNMWEIRAKALIKEINDRYHNFENREQLFSLVKNQPLVIDSILAQAQKGNAVTKNFYNMDEVLTIMLNKLANLNSDVQSYYNKWNREKNLVTIANAEKELDV
ncbi:hypothetical protein KI387_022521, partial [Taxus chinensis]